MGTEGSCTSEIVSQTQNMTTLNPSPQPDSHEIWGEHEPALCLLRGLLLEAVLVVTGRNGPGERARHWAVTSICCPSILRTRT